MRQWVIGLVVLSLSILFFVISRGAPAGAAPGAGGKTEVLYVPGEILIKFKPAVKAHDRGRARAEVDAATKHVFKSGAEHWRIGPGVSVEDAVERLKKNPLVEYAEPNYILKADLVPNDPYLYLHGLDQIRASQAWNISRGSPDVVVGVLDTGVDYNHPDLADNIWSNPGEISGNHLDDDGNGYVDDVHGYDFVNLDNDPFDDTIFFAFGHGTHVSGTIGAVGDNGVGIAGVNWRVKIMPLKVLDASGSGAISGIVSAIDYAAAMGVGITNNSYGGYVPYISTLEAAISRASATMLFVAAAGNESTNIDTGPYFYPASFHLPNMVSVAATDYGGNLAYFSNYGPRSVHLGAPGVDILSTVPGNLYWSYSGTSMATPHVAGVAALVRARFPSLSVEQLKAALLGSVDLTPALSGVTVSGGRLNAFAALGGTQDSIAPERITNLTTSTPGSGSMVLTWTATGDDGSSGTAGYYDVRYSTSPLDGSSFAAATRTGNEPVPLGSGSIQTMEVGGLDPGTLYHFAIKAFDDSGNPGPLSNVATATTLGPPRVGLAPAIVEESVATGQRMDTTITLRNDGEGTLDFTIPLPVLGVPVASAFEHLSLGKGEPDPRRGDLIAQRVGGPDPFGYRWIDSDEPGGPRFEWIEISGTGTPIPIAGDDLTSDPIPLGFGFPFYDSTFNSIRVCTNGFLSFTSNSAEYWNDYLPSFFYAPENLIAAFWDDLINPGGPAGIYYQTFGNRAVVEWSGVPHFCCGGPYTFETILDSSGVITLQYLRLTGDVTGATVGIQNSTGTMGLQVAFNQPYLHDNMAIRLSALPQWLTTSPKAGRIAAGGSLPVTVHIDARGLDVGVYPGVVNIKTNDPLSRLVPVPVSLTVLPDSDRDGVGDPVDNCPSFFNSQQEDADHDRVGDFCDPCTDIDGDGSGDPGFWNNICPLDDCPGTPNPLQEDLDGDRIGDVCDRCPLDPLNDADRDDRCADVDNCPTVSNPGQDDSDDDSAGDLCDNCPTIPNPDQADTNLDGSGNGCQPILTLVGIRSIGPDALEATVEAGDPQSDPLSGTVEIFETAGETRLLDLGTSGDCAQGYFPEGIASRGIGFVWRSYGSPLLFDFNLGAVFFGLGCAHGPSPDYLLRPGRCDDPSARSFSETLDLSTLAVPAPICLGKIEPGGWGVSSTLFDVTVEAFDPDSVTLSAHGTSRPIAVSFGPVLPQIVDISSLVSGAEHRLVITVTDGTTLPVTARSPFAYAGESRLILVAPNAPPRAGISAPTMVECTGPEGGTVTVDGSASTDPDSTPGTNDDIVSYEWFLDFGKPSQRALGSGRVLTLTWPLGAHAITLDVTDSQGATSTAETVLNVRDTTPPALAMALDQTVLWPPNHRLVSVHVNLQSSDLCDPSASVALVSVASSEPDDAPGDGDGRTTGDVDGAASGTPDTEFLLRAERSGGGAGRSYAVVYRSVDASGNSADAFAYALVPHDLEGISEPLTLSVHQTGAGTTVAWSHVVAALFYDVVRGDVKRLKEGRDVIDLGPVICLEAGTLDTTTSGHEDHEDPVPGDAFFYLVGYDDGRGSVGYGTASVVKPRVASSGYCSP